MKQISKNSRRPKWNEITNTLSAHQQVNGNCSSTFFVCDDHELARFIQNHHKNIRFDKLFAILIAGGETISIALSIRPKRIVSFHSFFRSFIVCLCVCFLLLLAYIAIRTSIVSSSSVCVRSVSSFISFSFAHFSMCVLFLCVCVYVRVFIQSKCVLGAR